MLCLPSIVSHGASILRAYDYFQDIVARIVQRLLCIVPMYHLISQGSPLVPTSSKQDPAPVYSVRAEMEAGYGCLLSAFRSASTLLMQDPQ